MPDLVPILKLRLALTRMPSLDCMHVIARASGRLAVLGAELHPLLLDSGPAKSLVLAWLAAWLDILAI